MRKIIYTQGGMQKYFRSLLREAINAQGTPSKSIEELLIEKAILYGRPIDIAKDDVKKVIDVVSAVDILLNRLALRELEIKDNSS